VVGGGGGGGAGGGGGGGGRGRARAGGGAPRPSPPGAGPASSRTRPSPSRQMRRLPGEVTVAGPERRALSGSAPPATVGGRRWTLADGKASSMISRGRSEGHELSLIRKRSVVQVHVAPPPIQPAQARHLPDRFV